MVLWIAKLAIWLDLNVFYETILRAGPDQTASKTDGAARGQKWADDWKLAILSEKKQKAGNIFAKFGGEIFQRDEETKSGLAAKNSFSLLDF